VFFHLPLGEAVVSFLLLTIVGTVLLFSGSMMLFYWLKRDSNWSDELSEGEQE
jgi:hypothetical protein